MSKNYNDIFGEKDDISHIVNNVYDIGYDKGYHDRQIEEEFDEDRAKAIEEAYQKGLADAWECAKLIALPCEKGGFNYDALRDIFFDFDSWQKLFMNHSALEVVAKIKEYEEKKKADDEIKVGDEVRSGIKKGIVIAIESDGESPIKILWDEPLHCNNCTVAGAKSIKTGKHYDIQNIFDQMRNEQ